MSNIYFGKDIGASVARNSLYGVTDSWPKKNPNIHNDTPTVEDLIKSSMAYDVVRQVMNLGPTCARFALPEIKDVIFHDPEKGLAMAICKKSLGNAGNYYNELKKWLPEEQTAGDDAALAAYYDAINDIPIVYVHRPSEKCWTQPLPIPSAVEFEFVEFNP